MATYWRYGEFREPNSDSPIKEEFRLDTSKLEEDDTVGEEAKSTAIDPSNKAEMEAIS